MIFTATSGIKKNRMDWLLFFSVLALLTIGTLAIFSSVAVLPNQIRIIRTHLIAIPLGFMLKAKFCIYTVAEVFLEGHEERALDTMRA